MSEPAISQTFPFENFTPAIRSIIYKWVTIQQSEASRHPAPIPKLRFDGSAMPTTISYYDRCIMWQLERLLPAHPPRIPLRSLQIPTLAAVSHKIRDEMLSEFFAAGRFIITVGPWTGANQHHVTRRTDKYELDLFNAERAAAGPADPVFLTQRVVTLLEKYNKEAVFRDVKFCLRDRDWNEPPRMNFEEYGSVEIATVTLVWQNKRLDVEISGEDEPERASESVIAGPVVELATEPTLRDGFKGFTIGDLRKFASLLKSGAMSAVPEA